jgi:hypothetical protein
MLRGNRAQDLDQTEHFWTVVHAEDELARNGAAEILGTVLEIAGRIDNPARLLAQHFPGAGKLHALRAAVEEPYTHLVLERLDLRADSGLAGEKLLRGTRQVLLFSDGEKGAELVEFHGGKRSDLPR